jgi:hypothetical protein
MSNETTKAGFLGDWQKLLKSFEENPDDLSYLEVPRTKLAGLVTRAVEINHQQAAMAASKQAATRELRAIFAEGRRLATSLRRMVQDRYGIEAEKLTEFGMQPFRGRPFIPRKRQPKPDPQSPATPNPANPAS